MGWADNFPIIRNRPISQIPQCIKYPTMHHFATEMCTHYKMVYCGIWDWRVVGFVQQVYYWADNSFPWADNINRLITLDTMWYYVVSTNQLTLHIDFTIVIWGANQKCPRAGYGYVHIQKYPRTKENGINDWFWHGRSGVGCCFLLKLEYYSSENLLN